MFMVEIIVELIHQMGPMRQTIQTGMDLMSTMMASYILTKPCKLA